VLSASSIAFNASPAYTEYTGLFDQYRIRLIEAWLEPIAAQGTTVFGPVASAIDLDDANSPGNLASVQAKQDSLTSYGGSSHYHRWVPHCALAAYSGVFTSFANVTAPWIDSASPAVQHFGLKYAALPTPAAVPYRLNVRMHLSFRAPGI
jgi:hypothetical protein